MLIFVHTAENPRAGAPRLADRHSSPSLSLTAPKCSTTNLAESPVLLPGRSPARPLSPVPRLARNLAPSMPRMLRLAHRAARPACPAPRLARRAAQSRPPMFRLAHKDGPLGNGLHIQAADHCHQVHQAPFIHPPRRGHSHRDRHQACFRTLHLGRSLEKRPAHPSAQPGPASRCSSSLPCWQWWARLQAEQWPRWPCVIIICLMDTYMRQDQVLSLA